VPSVSIGFCGVVSTAVVSIGSVGWLVGFGAGRNQVLLFSALREKPFTHSFLSNTEISYVGSWIPPPPKKK
jgi:hypothetical protein